MSSCCQATSIKIFLNFQDISMDTGKVQSTSNRDHVRWATVKHKKVDVCVFNMVNSVWAFEKFLCWPGCGGGCRLHLSTGNTRMIFSCLPQYLYDQLPSFPPIHSDRAQPYTRNRYRNVSIIFRSVLEGECCPKHSPSDTDLCNKVKPDSV